jgi:hypothetical protein
MPTLTFETSEDSRILRNMLEPATFGQTFTYAEMEAAVGKPISKFRGALLTARRQLSREAGIEFGIERKIGIRRLTDDEIATASVTNRKSIGRKAKRSAQILNNADYSMLSASKQLLATATMSIFLAIRAQVSDQSVRAIQAVGGSAKSLPIKETLQALLRSREN